MTRAEPSASDVAADAASGGEQVASSRSRAGNRAGRRTSRRRRGTRSARRPCLRARARSARRRARSPSAKRAAAEDLVARQTVAADDAAALADADLRRDVRDERVRERGDLAAQERGEGRDPPPPGALGGGEPIAVRRHVERAERELRDDLARRVVGRQPRSLDPAGSAPVRLGGGDAAESGEPGAAADRARGDALQTKTSEQSWRSARAGDSVGAPAASAAIASPLASTRAPHATSRDALPARETHVGDARRRRRRPP